jgi:hypothetical protein
MKALVALTLLLSVQGAYAQNSTPVALPDDYMVGFNTTRTINATNGLLDNDNDVDGNGTMSVRTSPVIDVSSGNLTLNTDGSFTYTPNINFVGTDTFTYQVCDNGTPSTLVSQFDFDTPTLTDATVGPNATSINPNAAPIECGVHIPRGSTGGNVGLDLVIPNTGGIFNFTSFEVAFEYRDQESQASLIEGGNFSLYHIRANDLGMSLTVINGTTGLQETVILDLGPFLSGNNPYSVIYNEITGEVIYDANGTVTTYAVAPPFSPLDASLATAITVGRQLDNSGRDFASFCSVAFHDRSILCDTAVVSLEVRANIITNRRITYRIKPN